MTEESYARMAMLSCTDSELRSIIDSDNPRHIRTAARRELNYRIRVEISLACDDFCDSLRTASILMDNFTDDVVDGLGMSSDAFRTI